MFLSILDQFGVFFLILIGVIVLLTIGYVILSRPRKVKLDESVKRANKEESVSKPIVSGKTQEQNETTSEVSKKKPQVDMLLEPEEFVTKHSEDVQPDVQEEKEKPKTKVESKELVDDFKKIDDIIEAEREKNDIDDDPVQTQAEPDAKKQLKENEKRIQELINQDKDSSEEKELGRYHVLYRIEDKKWYIKREGSDKITKVLPTQKEAIAFATIKAINQKTSVVIHKRDGKIRKGSY